jgi:hypothetical protein
MSDAVLLAAVFEGLKRSRDQWAIVIPEAFRPVPLNSSTLPKPHASESHEEFLRRRRIFAALGSVPKHKAPDGILGQLVDSKAWATFSEERTSCPCKYCLANDLATQDTPHAKLWQRRKVVRHADFAIDFNPDTYITKVSVSNLAVQMPESWAWALAENADPRQWSTAVPDFFLKSNPAKRDQSGWYEEEWDTEAGGDLYEVTRWKWNEGMAAEVHNILEISNVDKAAGISYDYSLRECLRSNMGVTWEEGGLDVDEGFYRLQILPLTADARPATAAATKASKSAARVPESESESESESSGDVLVKISAEKSVRYTTPRISPMEVGTVLNLMAPATVSMLMRRLVLDSVNPPHADEDNDDASAA